MKADRGGGTVGDRHLLGVVACTAVHCLNIIVTVSKLLDIVGADFQTGNGDGTLGIRCMGAGHQCGATGIGVDSKFPACQIQPVAGRFGQTEVSGFDLMKVTEAAAPPAMVTFCGLVPEHTYFSFTEESVWPISFT